jgi:ketose-bisphosphate aldolase
MLARGKGALESACRGGHAVGAFSVYNLEGAQAVCRASEAGGTPAIIQAGSSAFKYAGRKPLAALALAAAEESGAEVGVHLDHSRDLFEIRECLKLGYTSVMVDGSKLPFEQNVRFTREAASIAHEAGAWIEAELGGLSGDEDRSGSGGAGDDRTDPRAAGRFVEQTGVDALAVAIGNVHGFVPYDVNLDLELLRAIRERVPIPLVLHGASGLPDEQVQGAIALGVAKINVNAELRRAFIGGLKESVGTLSSQEDGLAAVLSPATGRMQEAAARKLRFFSRAAEGRAVTQQNPPAGRSGAGGRS